LYYVTYVVYHLHLQYLAGSSLPDGELRMWISRAVTGWCLSGVLLIIFSHTGKKVAVDMIRGQTTLGRPMVRGVFHCQRRRCSSTVSLRQMMMITTMMLRMLMRKSIVGWLSGGVTSTAIVVVITGIGAVSPTVLRRAQPGSVVTALWYFIHPSILPIWQA